MSEMTEAVPSSVPSAVRRDWRIPDALWAKLEPLIPAHTPRPHPLGCHRRRVPDRQAMDAIFFVLRTGCRWNALNVTGLCSSSVAHARCQEWCAAGVLEALWAQGLAEYDGLVGLDWSWLALDGAITKAPSVPRAEEQRQAGKRGTRSRRSAPARSTGAKAGPSAAC